MVRESFKIALQERPGAVHIELPEDIAREEVDEQLFPVHSPRYPVARNEGLQNAIDMLYEAKMPLVLIGAGANRTRIGSAMKDFIDKLGIPFFMTQMGKGVVDEFHPLYLGNGCTLR